MRFFFACLAHETNNRSPIPTTLANFEEMFLYRRSTGQNPAQRDAFYRMIDMPRIAAEQGHELCDSLIAFAMPSLPLRRDQYEALRDELLADLAAAMPVDFVCLFLHGAQMAEGYDDVESDVVRAVRNLVGPGIPIGLVLDLHANATEAMIGAADIVLACKEYPHTDWHDQTALLVGLLTRTARGEIRPVTGFRRVPMLDLFPTTEEPFRSFVERVRRAERSPILSATLLHGFPIADCAHAGASVVVVADGDGEAADRLADELAGEFFSMRLSRPETTLSIDEAIDAVLATPGGPVVISDNSDSEGGAAPGDSTFFLARLLERRVPGAAVAMLWDPMAVQFAIAAGVGATLPLRIGGKVGATSGLPLDVIAKVTAIKLDASQQGLGTTHRFGPAAAIEVDGVAIVLSSIRQQTFSPECFSELGIDPAGKKLLVVKSAQHFQALFQPVVTRILRSGRYTSQRDRYLHGGFRHLPRPVWPIDATPFEAFGRRWT